MILQTTTDINLIKNIMTDNDIWEKISADGDTKDGFNPVLPENVTVLSAVVDSVIGLHIFTQHSDRVLYHPMLLKEYRNSHGRVFFKKGLEWFFDNTSSDVLEAEIPVNHISTINLAEKLNFKKINTKRDGIKKDGQLIDLQVLRLDK